MKGFVLEKWRLGAHYFAGYTDDVDHPHLSLPQMDIRGRMSSLEVPIISCLVVRNVYDK